jgi:hypothetical protein
MIDPPAFQALMTAQRAHDLAGAQRACAAKDLPEFTLSLCMTILADFGDLDGSYAIAANLYSAWKATNTDGDRFWLDHLDGFDTAILNAPAAKAMRRDPRFLEVASKQGLLAYWRARGLPDFCTKEHEPECARIARG